MRKFDYEKRINVELNLKVEELNRELKKQKDENDRLRGRIKDVKENDGIRRLSKEQYDDIINGLKKQIEETTQGNMKMQKQIDTLCSDLRVKDGSSEGKGQNMEFENISNDETQPNSMMSIANIDSRIRLIEFKVPKIRSELSFKKKQVEELKLMVSQAGQDYETVKADCSIMESKISSSKKNKDELIDTISDK